MSGMSEDMVWMVVGGALFLLVVIVAMLLFGDDKGGALERRVKRVGGEPFPSRIKERKEVVSIRRATSDSSIPFLDVLIKKALPNPDKLRARLARTGRDIRLGTYVLINALAVLVFSVVFINLAGMKPVSGGLLGVAVGVFLPHFVTGAMGRRRVTKFLKLFPESIDTICRGLRSGLPVSESIAAVGREMPDPIGIEFRRITDAVRLGRSMDDAMWDVAKRIDTPELRFLIISMSIQRETGGNLAETLGNLADLLRKRRQLRLKIRALSSEARASAMIIGALPFVMFIILFLVNRDYMMLLLTTGKGKALLTGAFVLMGVGHGVMAKMIRFDI